MTFVFIDPRRSRKKAKKSGEAQRVLDALNDYLERNTQEPVQWLVRFWKDQASVFTYKDLRNLVMDEKEPERIFHTWFQDYSKLLSDRITPMWRDAFLAGAHSNPTVVNAGFEVNTSATQVREWILNRGAELVTNVSREQVDALKYILAESHAEGMSAAETARYIRPIVGLTKPQAAANLRYYNSIKDQLREDHPRMTDASIEKKARMAATKYAEKQQRTRAETIARTESAYAYNYGNDTAIRQAIEAGKVPIMRKVWSTAADGHVCGACEDLEGTEIDMDKDFNVTIGKKAKRTLSVTLPPLHPRCKCAVMYEETGEYKNQVDNPTPDGIIDLNSKGEDLPYYLQDNPEVLRRFTPDQIKGAMETNGMIVKPLSRGNLKGISFEDGGGFKVNFGGDGIFQYHPEKNSHHGAAYYKIATGEKGIQRIIIEGSGNNGSDDTRNQ